MQVTICRVLKSNRETRWESYLCITFCYKQIFFLQKIEETVKYTVCNPILYLGVLMFKVLNSATTAFSSSSDLENNCSS